MPTERTDSRRREAGAALIVAVVALLMAAMIAVSALQHSQEESTSGARSRNTAHTLHAADAGIQLALVRLSKSPPNLAAFSVNVDGVTVQSRERTDATPQAIEQQDMGAPPEGYAINVGSDSGFAGRVYQVNVTGTAGSAVAELEVRFRRIETGGSSY